MAHKMTDEARRLLDLYHEQYKSPMAANHYVAPTPPPVMAEPPEIGDRKSFVPGCNCGFGGSGLAGELLVPVTGTVVQVNEAHRWYRVAYEMGTRYPCIGYECFKF